MHFTLDLIQDGDACGPAVHAKGPTDLLRKLTPKMPAAPANLGLINLDWPRQLQVRQHTRVHIVVRGFAKQHELLLKRVTATTHVSSHLGRRAPDPHG